MLLSTPSFINQGAKLYLVFKLSLRPMQIVLENAGKRFNRDWIFRRLNITFSAGVHYAITGPNGSGKSTLLQVIAGAVNISEGSIGYSMAGNSIKPEDSYKHLSIAAPYLELVEEMTATEFLTFHQTFKPFIVGLNIVSIIEEVGLKNAATRQIRNFSSGMKQRLKLAQAIFSNVPVVLLDEPCTNLDATGYELYKVLIAKYCNQRMVLVSSNDTNEYSFCTERLNILDYKKTL